MKMIVLWVFKILFANPARDYSTGSYSMPSQPVGWCFPALTDKLWLKSHCWGLCFPRGCGSFVLLVAGLCSLGTFVCEAIFWWHQDMDAVSDMWWLYHFLKKAWCPSWFGLNFLRWDGISRRTEKCCFLLDLPFSRIEELDFSFGSAPDVFGWVHWCQSSPCGLTFGVEVFSLLWKNRTYKGCMLITALGTEKSLTLGWIW